MIEVGEPVDIAPGHPARSVLPCILVVGGDAKASLQTVALVQRNVRAEGIGEVIKIDIGITDALFRTFLIYVASSGQPPHELIKPFFSELAFITAFESMTVVPVSLGELKDARVRLTDDLLTRLDDNAMRFLLSLHDTEPDFEAIGIPQAANLPAVRWKLLNLTKLKEQNPEKHAQQGQEIENILS
ncbi:hypothetical protein C7476_11145 [Phyllobacterium bourgognense]|uniref:Nucleotidyltransferase AbiEii toxin of type IV toxin-antitoxin system n=2 Tax=Phyllobacterium bourgognense TaxID=314236 RepID=A0A368YLR7_9HYPH|nr:hypothetical protein C7476_11145 [Phyllobacterium bourgognense]